MDAPSPPSPDTLHDVPGSGQLMARLVTSVGDLEAYLYEHQTPHTVANFVALARGGSPWRRPDGCICTDPLYSGTVFHRVIPDFMIQGGCPEGTGRGDPGYRFDDEIDATLNHDVPGVLAMANAGPGTNGSQFYITEVPAPWLDGRHTVFGRVVQGLPLVGRISRMGPGRVVLEQVVIHRRGD